MTSAASGHIEMYRKADLRLRQLLLGDGVDTAGRVRGEEHRQQVIAELRRMRGAFDAATLGVEESRAQKADVLVAGLEEELRGIASLRSRTQHTWVDAIPAFVTPAEAAQALRTSVGTIYRAVREGEIRAVRLTGKKRGALRIPASELQRLLETEPRRGVKLAADAVHSRFARDERG